MIYSLTKCELTRYTCDKLLEFILANLCTIQRTFTLYIHVGISYKFPMILLNTIPICVWAQLTIYC